MLLPPLPLPNHAADFLPPPYSLPLLIFYRNYFFVNFNTYKINPTLSREFTDHFIIRDKWVNELYGLFDLDIQTRVP